MVMPDLLVPGMRASVWAQPMRNASLKVKSFISRVDGDFASAHQRIMPKITVIHAMTCMVLSQSGSSVWRIRPAMMTGIELMRTYRLSLAFCVFVFLVPMSFMPQSIFITSRRK